MISKEEERSPLYQCGIQTSPARHQEFCLDQDWTALKKKKHNINWCHGFNSNFTNKTTIYVNNDEHHHEIHKFSLAIKIKLGESI